MGTKSRGQLCLALLCVVLFLSGATAVPRTAASQTRLGGTGLFQQINTQVKIMTDLLGELDAAVDGLTTVEPTTTTAGPTTTTAGPTTTTTAGSTTTTHPDQSSTTPAESTSPEATTTTEPTTPEATTPTEPTTPETTTSAEPTTPEATTPAEPTTPKATTPTEHTTPEPTTPTEPTTPEATTPTEPTTPEPTTPTEPTTPEATTPTEPTTPEATTPTEPTTPEATTPTEPTTPEATTPTEPTTPEATTPTEPTTPEATTPTEPTTPEATTPTEPTTPEPTTPTEPATPEATTPTEPTTPEATTPTEPTTPEATTPTKPTTPEATTPTEPTTPEATTPTSEIKAKEHPLANIKTLSVLIDSLNTAQSEVNGDPTCKEAQDALGPTFQEADEALQKVTDEEFTQDTLDDLITSNKKLDVTLDCANNFSLTGEDKSSLQISIKKTGQWVDAADNTIDNILNPTPAPLPGLEISSPFMIVLITFSCLLAVVALVGVAMTVSRSLRRPPSGLSTRRRPGTGRVNPGYRPPDTDTTELVERPAGRRRAAPSAPVQESPEPALSVDPDRYDRMYEGVIPRAHAVSSPEQSQSWAGVLHQPSHQSAPPAKREFYNAY